MIAKNTATYDLNSIKLAFDHSSKLVMTTSAKQGQIMLNFTDEDVISAIQALSPSDFYKSMTPIRPEYMQILLLGKMFIKRNLRE